VYAARRASLEKRKSEESKQQELADATTFGEAKAQVCRSSGTDLAAGPVSVWVTLYGCLDDRREVRMCGYTIHGASHAPPGLKLSRRVGYPTVLY
jgi:hypothetical protein